MPQPVISARSGFTEGELKFASFWVRHQLVLRRGIYGGLVGLNVILWGYVFWGILDTVAISYPRESRIISDIARNQVTLAALETDRPRNVSQIDSPIVLQTTDQRFDIFVDLDNPNEQWWADFTYRFNLAGEVTPPKNGFIMPGSRTTITELGYRPKNPGAAIAQLVVEGVRWHRVDPAQVGARYKDYELDRSNFQFENVDFLSDVTLGSQTVSRTTFDMVNRSAFGYWHTDLVVRLYRGSSIVAINKITLGKLSPGETRHVELDWFERLPGITRTEITPIINYLDKGTFLPTTQF